MEVFRKEDLDAKNNKTLEKVMENYSNYLKFQRDLRKANPKYSVNTISKRGAQLWQYLNAPDKALRDERSQSNKKKQHKETVKAGVNSVKNSDKFKTALKRRAKSPKYATKRKRPRLEVCVSTSLEPEPMSSQVTQRPQLLKELATETKASKSPMRRKIAKRRTVSQKKANANVTLDNEARERSVLAKKTAQLLKDLNNEAIEGQLKKPNKLNTPYSKAALPEEYGSLRMSEFKSLNATYSKSPNHSMVGKSPKRTNKSKVKRKISSNFSSDEEYEPKIKSRREQSKPAKSSKTKKVTRRQAGNKSTLKRIRSVVTCGIESQEARKALPKKRKPQKSMSTRSSKRHNKSKLKKVSSNISHNKVYEAFDKSSIRSRMAQLVKQFLVEHKSTDKLESGKKSKKKLKPKLKKLIPITPKSSKTEEHELESLMHKNRSTQVFMDSNTENNYPSPSNVINRINSAQQSRASSIKTDDSFNLLFNPAHKPPMKSKSAVLYNELTGKNKPRYKKSRQWINQSNLMEVRANINSIRTTPATD
ncbi:uncharacterized protein LOC126266470 [Aethina tumida]|uniref:uncharacterized protein LOC126266470 n=1 Tax=Aethina tumida TaxID=116153 RepID=UPI002147F2DF|nr:uncharacterized protein LOC126266470 [Aethina tumida]